MSLTSSIESLTFKTYFDFPSIFKAPKGTFLYKRSQSDSLEVLSLIAFLEKAD
jgi:hypothetical protein